MPPFDEEEQQSTTSLYSNPAGVSPTDSSSATVISSIQKQIEVPVSNFEIYNGLVDEIVTSSQDADEGLSLLQDAYTKYGQGLGTSGKVLLADKTTELLRKFQANQKLSLEETLEIAPISFESITPSKSGLGEKEQRIDILNQWEEQNLKAIGESDSVAMIQSRNQLERSIKTTAIESRREIYGGDNGYITEALLRPAAGATKGITDAFGYGNIFHENTNPDWDDNFFAQVAEGVGMAGTAVAAGAVLGPVGAYGYMAAQGAGSVRGTVEESLDAGATVPQALTAGAIETGNQAFQTLVGGKFFGKAGARIFGKAAARPYSHAVKELVENALTEGAGSVVSDYAMSVGTGTEFEFDGTRTLQAAGVGAVTAGIASGGSEAYARHKYGKALDAAKGKSVDEVRAKADEAITSGRLDLGLTELSQGDIKAEVEAAKQVVEDTEGTSPPPRETISERYKSAELDPSKTETVFELEDGQTSYVSDGTKLHLKAGDKALQTYDDTFFVSPEVAAKLRETVKGETPDGTEVALVTKNGRLYVQNDWLGPDLAINTAGKTDGTQVEVATMRDAAPGLVPVQANRVRVENGIRRTGFFIAPSAIGKVNSTAGAAYLTDLGTKAHNNFARLVMSYGDELAEREGIAVKSEKGEMLSLWRYLPLPDKESADISRQEINRDGVLRTLSDIAARDNDVISEKDESKLKYLEVTTQKAIDDALESGNFDELPRLIGLKTEVSSLQNKSDTPWGRIGRLKQPDTFHHLTGKTGPGGDGQVQVNLIRAHLINQAQAQIETEFGRGTKIVKLAEEAKAAELETKEAEAEAAVNDPFDKDIEKQDRIYQEEGQRLADEDQKNIQTWKDRSAVLEDDLKLKTEAREELKRRAPEARARREAAIEADHQRKIQEQDERAAKALAADRQEQLARMTKERDTAAATVEQLKAELAKAQETGGKGIGKLTKAVESGEKKVSALTETLAKGEVTPRGKTTNTLESVEVRKRKATTDRADALAELANETEKAEKASATPTKEVLSQERKDLAAAKRAVRKLQKEAKQPKAETPAQVAARERKAAKEQERKEGKAHPGEKAKADRQLLSDAQKKQNAANRKLARAKKILEEHLGKFPEGDRNRLSMLYDLLAKTPEGEAHHKLASAIFEIEAQHLPLDGDPTLAEKVFNFWRGNILSGPDTHIRNLIGNVTQAASTYGATLVTMGPAAASIYAKGWASGLYQGGLEAGQILAGNRQGRLKAETVEEADKARNLNKTISSTERGAAVSMKLEKPGLFKPTGGLLGRAIPELSRRLLSASDAIFYRSSVNGMTYLLEDLAAKKEGLKSYSDRVAWIENTIFKTGDRRTQIKMSVAQQVDILKGAGIEMTKWQQKLAEYEGMQRETDSRIRELAEKHGERDVLIQTPDGVAGFMVNMIKSAQTDSKDHPILANMMNFAFPFVRITANIANAYLDHTPVGFVRAQGLNLGTVKAFGTEVPLKVKGLKQRYIDDVQKNIDSTTKDLEKALANGADAKTIDTLETTLDRYRNQLTDESTGVEARLVMGKAIIGTTLMVGLFGAMMRFKDEEEPPIEFFGNYPPGKYRDWQAQGKKPYSIRMGDVTIGLQNTPLALVGAILGGAQEAARKGADPTKLASAVALASVGAFATLTTIKPMADLFSALTGADWPEDGTFSSKMTKTITNHLATQVYNYGSGFVPSAGLLKNVSRWMSESPDETYNNLAAKFKQMIPYSRSDLGIGKPQINIFGEPITKSLLSRTALGDFFSTRDIDPVFQWMEQTGYKVTDPGPIMKMTEKETAKFGDLQAERTKGVFGEYRDILDENQSYEVMKLAGPEIKQMLGRVMNHPRARVFEPKIQDQINEAVSKIRARAKLEILLGR